MGRQSSTTSIKRPTTYFKDLRAIWQPRHRGKVHGRTYSFVKGERIFQSLQSSNVYSPSVNSTRGLDVAGRTVGRGLTAVTLEPGVEDSAAPPPLRQPHGTSSLSPCRFCFSCSLGWSLLTYCFRRRHTPKECVLSVDTSVPPVFSFVLSTCHLTVFPLAG